MSDSRLEPLVLSEAERRTLSNRARRRTTAQGLALRARIVLACADGGPSIAVAARLGVNRGTVAKWRSRFLRARLDGLSGEPRPGVPRTITDAQVEEVVVRTLEEVPEGATHWPKRELAKRAGISPASVLRIWHAFGLQPRRTETFKISPDPLLTGKIRDVIGLYLAPPAGAAVFAVDQKPHIQARERTAPVLPMIPRGARAAQLRLRAARHDRLVRRAEHRHREGDRQAVRPAPGGGLPRLPRPDRPPDRPRPGGPRELRQPRRAQGAGGPPLAAGPPGFVLHFTPAYSSWISQAGRWSAELQRRCLERGAFCSLDELKTALEGWIKTWNDNARPFKWTKTADQIIDRICRYCSRISEPAH